MVAIAAAAGQCYFFDVYKRCEALSYEVQKIEQDAIA
jgi:hypothetical protein